MARNGSVTQSLDDFLSNSSCHGISRIFHPIGFQRFSKCFRWIWLFVWLLAAATLIFQFKSIFDEYREFNAVSKVTVRKERSSLWPTVSVCLPPFSDPPKLSKKRVERWLRNCSFSMNPIQFWMCTYWSKKWQDVINGTYDQIQFEGDLQKALKTDDPELATKLSMDFADWISFGPEWIFSFPKSDCYSFNSDGKRQQNWPWERLRIFWNEKSHCFNERNCRMCAVIILHPPGTIPVITEATDIYAVIMGWKLFLNAKKDIGCPNHMGNAYLDTLPT